MRGKILVPLDGSPLAEMVLPQAILLARTTHSSLTLLRCTTPPPLTEALVGGLPAPPEAYPNREEEAEDARTYLAGVAARLGIQAIPVVVTVQDGDPAAAIVATAQQDPETLMIAMATHGRTGLGRWIFGSVAEKVLNAAPVPLLLVRPTKEGRPEPHPHAYKTILVPLDGSVFAEQALNQAVEMANTTGAAIALVCVVPELDEVAAAEMGEVPLWVLEDQDAEVTRMTQYLKATADRLRMAGIPTETRVVVGRPAEAILEASTQEHADLIVMATHGRSGLQRLWVGSVALRVARNANPPVLLVRAREPAEAPERKRVPAGAVTR